MFRRILRLNATGFDHVVTPAMFVILFAIIGTGYLVITKADSAGSIIKSDLDTGKCLDNANGRDVNSNKIVLYTCSESGAQKWTLDKNMIINSNGKCLDNANGTTKSAAVSIKLHACSTTTVNTGEVWDEETDGEFKNPATGQCLTDPNNSTTNNQILTIEPCKGTKNQKWTVVAPTSTTIGSGATSSNQ